MNELIKNEMTSGVSDTMWRNLYTVGGVAALLAGLIFRRNIAAELSLFSVPPPDTIREWFVLLQDKRLLGLTYLNVFDLVNYGLLAVMLLALFAALGQTNMSFMTIATAFGLLGIAVYFASNTAFSLLSLSEHYGAATTDAQKTVLLAAGQAMLALTRFSGPDAHPGAGGYMSLLLLALAGLIISIVMRQSTVFSRATAYVGMVASACDLLYCITFVVVPAGKHELVALCFIPFAGLFLMIWHIMIGWKLYQLGRLEGNMHPT